MSKYRLLQQRLAAVQYDWQIQLCQPQAVPLADVLRVHCPAYVARVLTGELSLAEQRRIGFPWSPAVAERTQRVSGATLWALLDAIDGQRIAINLAGGTHHAAYARGGGYCVLNDSVIAARGAIARQRVERVLIVDLDVHQGDGTAELCADDPAIYTFSMHCARNYPARKPPSDLDLALPDGTGDAVYLDLLQRYLDQAIQRSGAQAVIYLAGADPFIGDELGFLSLSKAGLRARDEWVISRCMDLRLPLAISMAGGYATAVEDIVDIHAATVEVAARALRHASG
jgi:acetoin utilization deacetylase AcuC-like enzyme